MNKVKYLWQSGVFALLMLGAVKGNGQTTTLPGITKTTAMAIGSISGGASVNLAGAATYTIPIPMPPGSNGMVPALSFSYSSLSGNGLLGMGWSMAGLSAIGRGNKTFLQDGMVANPDLSSADVLTLDGNRLVQMEDPNAGFYYLTKSESFTKITPQALVAGVATWFKVEGKDGTVYEYGRTTDSRFMSQNGAKIITWYLNKTYDTYGNYVEYKYNADHLTTREVLLDEIWYTGLQNNATNAVITAPYNRVKILYTARTDKNTFYAADNAMKQSVLVDKVQIFVEQAATSTTPNKFWTFIYGNVGIAGVANGLVEVKESALKTGTTYETYNSTLFKYGGDASVAATLPNPPAASGNTDVLRGDMNGDGYTDIIEAEYDNITTQIPYITPSQSAGSPEFVSSTVFNPTTGLYGKWVATINIDISKVTKISGGVFARDCSSVTRQPNPPYNSFTIKTYTKFRVKINNGDGTYTATGGDQTIPVNYNNIEYIGFLNDTLNKLRNVGNQNSSPIYHIVEWPYMDPGSYTGSAANFCTNWNQVNLPDYYFSLNPPTPLPYPAGLSDIYRHYTRADRFDVDQRFFRQVLLPDLNQIIIGDINGDGKDDITVSTQSACQNYATDYVNTKQYSYNGTTLSSLTNVYVDCAGNVGFPAIRGSAEFIDTKFNYQAVLVDLEGTNKSSLQFVKPNLYPIDFNGDGKTELFDYRNNKICDRNGNSLTTTLDLTTTPPYSANTKDVLTADFNGDGKTDFALVTTTNISVYYATGTKYTAPVVFSITQPYIASSIKIGDFDGNGLSDIIQMCAPATSLVTANVYYSFGENFTKKTYTFGTITPYLPLTIDFLGDFNGDGVTDISWTAKPLVSTPKLITFNNKGREPLLLQSIRNGLGIVTAFTYKPMTAKDGFYVKGTPAVATTDNSSTADINNASQTLYSVQFPMYLVSKIEANSVATGGGTTTATYKYENAVLQATGGGLLGFQKITSEDLTNNRRTVSEFEILCRNTAQLAAAAGSALATSSNYFFTTALKKQSTYAIATFDPLIAGQQISETININEVIDRGNTRIWLRSRDSESKDLLSGNKMVSSAIYDTYGNILTQTKKLFEKGNVSATPLELTTLTNTYPAAPALGAYIYGSWIPADPLTTESSYIYNTGVSGAAKVQKTNNTYHTTTGALLSQMATIGGSTTNATTTTHTYPTTANRGQILTTTISAIDITPRTTDFEYDAKVRFLTKTTSPTYSLYSVNTGLPTTGGLRDVVTKTYEPLYGNILTETAPDKRTVTYEYDAWGKVLKTTMPPSAATATPTTQFSTIATKAYAWDSPCYAITTAVSGAPTTVETFNKFGQVTSGIAQGIEGVYGSVISSNISTIDARGRTISTTAPTGLIVSTGYDDLNRLGGINKSGIIPNTLGESNFTTFAYTLTGGLKTTTTNTITGKITIAITDAAGKLISSTENGVNLMTYDYYKNGLPKTTKLDAVIVSEKEYDLRYLTSVSKDPMGVGNITYGYNALGELIAEAHGDLHTRAYKYDDIGRNVEVKITKGGVQQNLRTEYIYDNSTTWANNNTGKIAKVIFDKGNGNVHTTSSVYDQFGRVQQTTEVIADNATTAQTFVTSYGYDQYNNVVKQVYPSGLIIQRAYTAAGYLKEVANHDWSLKYFMATDITEQGYEEYRMNVSQTNTNGMQVYKDMYNGVLFQKTVFKGDGTASATVSNGIFYNQNIWDNSLTQIKQRFTDVRNTVAGAPTFPVGSFTNKRLAEQFTYDNFDRLTSIKTANVTFSGYPNVYIGFSYLFTATPTATPALAMTFANNGNITNKYDVGVIAYDATKIYAANSTQNTQGVISYSPQNITYTAYKQPSLIQEVVNTSTWKMALDYGADFQRCKSVLTQTTGTTTTIRDTRYYLGDYEVDIDNTTGTAINRQIHYIQGGDGVCAVIVKTNNGADEVYYPFTDHLGSIIAFADASANIVYERSFDAWGRRRNPFTFDYATPDAGIPANSPLKWWYRGYTSHEELPTFALINMNGRLYDPALGRMLSPDGIIHPGSQGINRYSYAFSNPIKYNDPNGHNPWAAVGIAAGIGAIANVVQNAGNIRNVGDFLGYAGVGAVAGAAALGAGYAGNQVGAAGTAAGATWGLITGTGNSLVQGENFANAISGGGMNGLRNGLGMGSSIDNALGRTGVSHSFGLNRKQSGIQLIDIGGENVYTYTGHTGEQSIMFQDEKPFSEWKTFEVSVQFLNRNGFSYAFEDIPLTALFKIEFIYKNGINVHGQKVKELQSISEKVVGFGINRQDAVGIGKYLFVIPKPTVEYMNKDKDGYHGMNLTVTAGVAGAGLIHEIVKLDFLGTAVYHFDFNSQGGGYNTDFNFTDSTFLTGHYRVRANIGELRKR
jgi:RHS repeat-associated protein